MRMPENGQAAHTPQMLWAQRDDLIYLTVAVEDIDKPEIRIEENNLFFKGYSNKNLYEANIELFKPINKDESKYGIYGQKHWMFILKKTERGPYWPRLLKDSKKVHWLKADWNKWKDEDEEEEEENDFSRNTDFNSMFQQMGGLGGDELPNLDDMEPPNEEEVDSDDEKLPDLEENKQAIPEATTA